LDLTRICGAGKPENLHAKLHYWDFCIYTVFQKRVAPNFCNSCINC